MLASDKFARQQSFNPSLQ